MTKIILDLCNNHLGSKRILDALISHAMSSEVEFVKFQLFNPEKLNPTYPNYEDYKAMCSECQINKEKLIYILNQFNWLKIRPMFTIFSPDRVDFLRENIDKPAWPIDLALKIPSPSMSDYRLIDWCLDSFPDNLLVISTGMHTDKQIVECMQKYKHLQNVKFLHCVSEYPTDKSDIDFNKINDMDGFSDHSLGVDIAKQCIAVGVEFYECHFTLSKNLPGKDHSISKDIDEINRIVRFRQTLANNDLYKERWKG